MIQKWLDASSVGLAGAGLLALALALSLRRRWRITLPITLELWTAAGLLRLCGEPSWSRIAAAASVIAVRRLIMLRAD